MSWNNKVVWSEGMFLRPQHFQQQARYTENFIEQRCAVLSPYAWGFTNLVLDAQLLRLGKIGIQSAQGVFPDGTPFNMPDDDDPPAPLDLPDGIHDCIIYLGLPPRQLGAIEYSNDEQAEGLARYQFREASVRDTSSISESVTELQVGTLRTRLLTDQMRRDEYACMGMTRVVECRIDKNVILDEQYLPPMLDINAIPRLGDFLTELHGLLHHRGEALAGRVTEAGQGGAAEFADFLLLQLVNRYEPLVAHLTQVRGLHPEVLFRFALSLAGEIATFTHKAKRPIEFPDYRHDELQQTFEPMMSELRKALSMVLEQNAVSIPLEERNFGIRVGALKDKKLIEQASFVLAVTANLPAEQLRKRLPAQIKIGPVEQIHKLVNLQLPGITLRALPVAPRQIPFHTGYSYFELDRSNDYWKEMRTSGGFAVHLGGEFPGIEMTLWAIRGKAL